MLNLIKKVKIGFTNSPFFYSIQDILLDDGKLVSISENIDYQDNYNVIEIPQVWLMPGFVETYSQLGWPGKEFLEDEDSIKQMAIQSGFTDIFISPNTLPIIDQATTIRLVYDKFNGSSANLHPIGAISVGLKEEKFAEILDMNLEGAIAFSNDYNSIQSPVFILKSLQYLKTIDKILIQTPNYSSLSDGGCINESSFSTAFGLPSIPAISEEMMVMRDILMAEYLDSAIHFNCISTKKSLDYIRNAKQKGLKITCSVSPAHLCFSENDIENYNSYLKIFPPLRLKEDQLSLIEGLYDGSIDMISANHQPFIIDDKKTDFVTASYGINSLEFTAPLLFSMFEDLPIQRKIELISINPRKIFNLDFPELKVQQNVRATLISTHEPYYLEKTFSKSGYSPFMKKKLSYKIQGLINKNGVFLSK
ncbi:MAG: dihydroorotase [Sediminibacterium sp.]|nr:dihydroorotase [Sediminibacterium sp.]